MRVSRPCFTVGTERVVALTRARENGRAVRAMPEEVVAREGPKRWRRDLETA
jgi:hypothetical protein